VVYSRGLCASALEIIYRSRRCCMWQLAEVRRCGLHNCTQSYVPEKPRALQVSMHRVHNPRDSGRQLIGADSHCVPPSSDCYCTVVYLRRWVVVAADERTCAPQAFAAPAPTSAPPAVCGLPQCTA
jgi:hypothetical protein